MKQESLHNQPGSCTDSRFRAWCQIAAGIFPVPPCQRLTPRPPHRCGSPFLPPKLNDRWQKPDQQQPSLSKRSIWHSAHSPTQEWGHPYPVCVCVCVLAAYWVPKSTFYWQTKDFFGKDIWAGPHNCKGFKVRWDLGLGQEPSPDPMDWVLHDVYDHHHCTRYRTVCLDEKDIVCLKKVFSIISIYHLNFSNKKSTFFLEIIFFSLLLNSKGKISLKL